MRSSLLKASISAANVEYVDFLHSENVGWSLAHWKLVDADTEDVAKYMWDHGAPFEIYKSHDVPHQLEEFSDNELKGWLSVRVTALIPFLVSTEHHEMGLLQEWGNEGCGFKDEIIRRLIQPTWHRGTCALCNSNQNIKGDAQ